jgi:uncharacterized protein YfaS (alpha-2-macroglobulin family)
MRRFIASFFLLVLTTGAARADDLSVSSNFVDTSSQTPSLCVQFNEALSPSLSAHYEDYVRVDHFSGLVAEVSGANLCIGGLPYETHYHLTLLAGLTAQSGDKLPNDTGIDFSPGDRPSLVAISGNGLYLAKRSATGLAITTVNVRKLAVHVLRLNDLNAIQDFSTIAGNQVFDPTQQSFNGDNLLSLIGGQAGVVWSGVMPVATVADQNVNTLFPIAAALGQSGDLMAGKPGVYLVVAEDAATAVPAGFWAGTLSGDAEANANSTSFATHWVVVTDLGLTAMTGDDGLHVVVRSISSAAAASGVRLNLISTGGDVLDSVTSDADGRAAFPAALLDGHLANAPLAVAAYGADGDFSYLPLTTGAFDLSDRGVTGRAAPVTNDAYLAADRGIFRPGETAHVLVLLHDADGHALARQTFSLGLVRPDTVQVGTIQAVTDDAGGAVVPVALPANALHGPWTIQAAIDPTLPPIGSLTLSVENFQPADMRVDATGAPARATPGAQLNLAAAGMYLYGAPALLPIKASVTITTDKTPIPGVTGYDFGLLNDQFADSETDLAAPDSAGPDGKVAFTGTIPQPAATTQPLRAKIAIGYMEPSGNITNAEQVVKLTTTKTLVGVKPLFQGGSVDSGAPAVFDLAAFDPDTGKMVADDVQIRIVRTDTIYDWVGSAGSWTWHSYTVDHPVALTQLALDGGGPTEVSRALPDGDYTIIAADPRTGAATSVAFSVGWSGLGASASTPDTLDLTADHTLLATGGTAKIHISGPFAGTADVLVANNRVYSQQVVTVPKEGADFAVTASSNWNGGAYVIADLHRGSAGAPGHVSVRAIGVGWLGLDPAPHTLGVTIGAPATILPRTQQTVTVKITGAASGAKIHLALDVMDEGILGLTKYKTPDPVGWFWGQRQLGVEIRDIYGALLNDQGEAGSITQGGDEGAGGPRVPLQSNKLFAVASADLTVGADGMIQIPLTVPDFEGQARLTAVAWTATQAGSGQADMVVRDPVVMNPGLPNFLSSGDHALLPLTLANVSGPAGAYTVSLSVAGAATPMTVTLAKSEQSVLEFPFAAGATGMVNLTFRLTGNGLDISRKFSIFIRPAHPPTFFTLAGPIRPGARMLLPAEIAASGADTGTAALSVGAFPGLNAQFLITALSTDDCCNDSVTAISKTFPLLTPAYAALYKGGTAAAKTAVEAAITLVANRQGLSGDIGDWSFAAGDEGYDDWVSAYAVDFLLSAQDAGFDVPNVVLDRAKLWLGAEGADLAQVITTQGTAYGSEAPAPFPSFVYTQWLLARTGHPNIGALRVVADALTSAISPDGYRLIFWGGNKTPSNLTAAGDLAKLSMALAAAGDSARAATVLNDAAAIVTTPGQSEWADGFWWTANQDAAITLLAAATAQNQAVFDAAAKKIDPQTLTEDDDDDAIAFLLRAIAAGDALAAGQRRTVTFAVGGKSQMVPVPGSADVSWPDLMNSKAIDFVSGTGDYDFSATYTPRAATAAFAHGMTLNVTLENFDGGAVDLTKLHQGDDVVVTISGSAPKTQTHLLQIVSLLPGCFSIEKSMPGPDDRPVFLHISAPESFSSDIDRFVASVRLGKPAWDTSSDSDSDPTAMPAGQFLVAYIVKVTTAGRFTMPEVTVRDRLHPAISAGSSSRTISVGQ